MIGKTEGLSKMRSDGLNREISISNVEREALVRSLVSAGINERIVNETLSPGSQICDRYWKVNPDSLFKLQSEIKNKNINIAKLDPSAAKLLR